MAKLNLSKYGIFLYRDIDFYVEKGNIWSLSKCILFFIVKLF